MSPSRRYTLKLLIAFAVLINFSGLFVDLMDPDAGVYASVSKNMLLHNDWLNLFFQDKDWLDKPHFPFWVTAFFFKLFGMHAWSYKLPGILFVMMGAGYTYRFARKFYNEEVALWSVFILLSSLHILISNNDVRAEPYLTGLIIASIYHFSSSLRKGFSADLVWGSLFAGLAMMTKGLFTLAPIAAAVGGHLLISAQWKQIFHWRWILAALLLLLFISPELYALWYQFDSHPEKVVFGKDHVSGIRFFLWDSQFGRFMNTGPIKGKGDPSFFLHTLLWAFLPWCLLMYAALYKKIRSLALAAERTKTEWYLFSGAVFTLLIFSLSKFQLPYYTNIIFPLLAILTANGLVEWINNNNAAWPKLHNGLTIITVILVCIISWLYQPSLTVKVAVLFFLTLLLLIYLVQRADLPIRPYLRAGTALLGVGLFLNLIFYPDLLQYQSGNQAAFYINKNYPGVPVARMKFYMPSGEFYLKEPVRAVDTAALAGGGYPKGGLLYVSAEEKAELDKAAIRYETIKTFSEYHITMLTLKFVDHKKREGQLKTFYLLRTI